MTIKVSGNKHSSCFIKYEDNDMALYYNQEMGVSNHCFKIGKTGLLFSLNIMEEKDINLRFFVNLEVHFENTEIIKTKAEGRFTPKLHSFGSTISPRINLFIPTPENAVSVFAKTGRSQLDITERLEFATYKILGITPTDQLAFLHDFKMNA